MTFRPVDAGFDEDFVSQIRVVKDEESTLAVALMDVRDDVSLLDAIADAGLATDRADALTLLMLHPGLLEDWIDLRTSLQPVAPFFSYAKAESEEDIDVAELLEEVHNQVRTSPGGSEGPGWDEAVEWIRTDGHSAMLMTSAFCLEVVGEENVPRVARASSRVIEGGALNFLDVNHRTLRIAGARWSEERWSHAWVNSAFGGLASFLPLDGIPEEVAVDLGMSAFNLRPFRIPAEAVDAEPGSIIIG